MTLWHDFCRFATAQVQSGDIDPVYPVLRHVFEQMGSTLQQRIWYTFLFVTFYHLGSAYQVWQWLPTPCKPPALPALKTGVERRGFRGNSLACQHIDHFFEITRGKPDVWLTACVGEGGMQGWQTVRRAFERIPYAGTWASYKWADLTAHVLDFPITAPDIGVGGKGETASPVAGLVRLTGKTWQQCASDLSLQQRVYQRCRQAGVPFRGIEEFETALCDFNSLCKGSYYMGHDIDSLQEALRGLPELFWQARRATLGNAYLGELNGWTGVRKPLKRVYADTGVIVL